jgi:hypothetical protein
MPEGARVRGGPIGVCGSSLISGFQPAAKHQRPEQNSPRQEKDPRADRHGHGVWQHVRDPEKNECKAGYDSRRDVKGDSGKQDRGNGAHPTIPDARAEASIVAEFCLTRCALTIAAPDPDRLSLAQ